MERTISTRIKDMTPSATVELKGKIEALKQKGIKIIPFTLGEPDFNTPANIIEAAKKAMDDGFTRYTAAAGFIDLREAICKKLLTDNNLSFQTDQIIVTTGGKQALYNTLMTICNPGDEVILPTPCWVSYTEMIKLAGGIPVLIKTTEESGFSLDPKEIEKAITPKTTAILINSPNNPTGAVYSKNNLEQLGKIAAERGIYIISDEIYEKLVYDGETHYSIASLCPEIKDLCIVINGFAKSYAMTGWRIGYAAGPSKIIKGMCDLQGHTTSNTNSIAQKAAVQALLGPQDSVVNMHDEFARRRTYIIDRLNNMQGVTCANVKGAFYVLPNVSALFGKSTGSKTIQSSLDVATYLLEEAHVGVVTGDAFYSPNNIRLTYATSMEYIKLGMDKMQACIDKLFK
ncbi:MAG: pyridoxal phosphate-dependent aminotransferase [Spirochaetaceae bacterium]|nr:pyridoxal phosphate-dependent aminotransferase [Spirochaetaceae bacterium]